MQVIALIWGILAGMAVVVASFVLGKNVESL